MRAEEIIAKYKSYINGNATYTTTLEELGVEMIKVVTYLYGRIEILEEEIRKLK